MIKAVFLDFDGTTFSHYTNRIPESTIEAIKLLNKKGILSFLATGRCKKEMTWFDISRLELTGSILNNGQLAITNDEKIIYDEPIKEPLKSKLIDIFNEKKLPIYLLTYDDIFINYVADNVIETQNKVSSVVPPVKEYKGQNIYMASAFFTNEEEKKEFYCLDANITCWQEGAIDIVPKGSSKCNGIDEVIKYYGIDISETMAFGDGENDIEMIKHCCVGVAMGNGKDIIKANADYITDDIDEDGIYNALKYYNLI